MSNLTPLVVEDVESAQWDDVADLVVVGLGAAGITAALVCFVFAFLYTSQLIQG